MKVYFDTSALVKHYVRESGTNEVNDLIRRATVISTALITRTEAVAAFAKAVRMRVLPEATALDQLQVFYRDWQTMMKVPIDDHLVMLAGELAWQHGLRGYNAVHLASAQRWQQILQKPITLATFDREQWRAAAAMGLQAYPPDLDAVQLS